MKQVIKECLQCFYPPAIVFLVFNKLIGDYGNLYVTWPLYDIPVHLLGGVSMGITGYMLFTLGEKRDWIHIANKWVLLFLIVCFVSLTATVWEWYEFAMDYFFETVHQPSLADTMGDMLLGIAGGVFAGITLLKRK